jgi:hypothetical protein
VRVSATAAPAADVPAKRVRLKRVLVFAAVLVVIGAAAQLLGWNVRNWLDELWDTMTGISAKYVVAGVVLKTVQTTLTAFGWYSILRFAYPGKVRWLDILACYAASVALNGILPANLGTLALLLMFTTIIAGATFAAILGAYAVQKIFFTLIGAFTYLYLFLSVGGSFDIKFAFIHEHPWATAIFLLGSGYLIYLVVRRLWPRVLVWWDDAKEGGSILAQPQLDRERDLGDPRRRRSQPGVQRGVPQRNREHTGRDCLFRDAAAGHDRLEHHLRDHHARLGLRLERRQTAGRRLVRGREGEGRGAACSARGP